MLKFPNLCVCVVFVERCSGFKIYLCEVSCVCSILDFLFFVIVHRLFLVLLLLNLLKHKLFGYVSIQRVLLGLDSVVSLIVLVL